MQRIKRLNKHFKPAQQIVELALVLPFFIITFSFVFQLMVETYSKYRFSYIFTNAVARAIELQQRQLTDHPYTTLDETLGFDFKQNVFDITKAAMQRVPNSGIQIADLQLDGINNYLSGIFINDVDRIFFRSSGLEYFYFIIPVGRIYFQPMVLNVDNGLLEEFFSDWYFLELAALYRTPAAGGGAAESETGADPTGGPSESTPPAAPAPPAPPSPPSLTGGMGGGIPDEPESELTPEAETSSFGAASPWGRIEAAK